jgi:cytochrome c-type biogenesis protein CcmE
MKNSKRRRIKIIATIVVALAGISYVAAQSLKDVRYFAMVWEVTAKPETFTSKQTVQVAGWVAPGSIKTEIVDQKSQRTFRLEGQGHEIEVRHTGTIPDTFKDLAQAVVTGRLVDEGGGRLVLYAKNGDEGVSAKCPSKYDGTR